MFVYSVFEHVVVFTLCVCLSFLMFGTVVVLLAACLYLRIWLLSVLFDVSKLFCALF